MQMWFVWAFQRWKASAVGRLRMKCMLGAHLERKGRFFYELAFKAWRKVAILRVRISEGIPTLTSLHGSTCASPLTSPLTSHT